MLAINMHEFENASDFAFTHGKNETQSLPLKKTLLSIAKISSLIGIPQSQTKFNNEVSTITISHIENLYI